MNTASISVMAVARTQPEECPILYQHCDSAFGKLLGRTWSPLKNATQAVV